MCRRWWLSRRGAEARGEEVVEGVGDLTGEVIMASSNLTGATSGTLRWSGRSCMVMFSVEEGDEGASDSRLLSCSPVLDMAFRPSMTVVVLRDRRF